MHRSQTSFYGCDASRNLICSTLPPAHHKTEVNGFQMSACEREGERRGEKGGGERRGGEGGVCVVIVEGESGLRFTAEA